MTENEKTYQVTAPSGKVWTLRSLPKHFFIYYGQLPQVFSAEVAKAVASGDIAAVEKEIESKLSPEEMMQTLAFIRDAVQYACVNPAISLSPKNDAEISPFQITPEDFDFLTVTVMKGGGSVGLTTFRSKSVETSPDRDDGAKIRRSSKRPARHRR